MNRITMLRTSTALLFVGLAAACGSAFDSGASPDGASSSGNASSSGSSGGGSDAGATKDGANVPDGWTDTGAPANGVNLGAAGTYAILAKSGISTVPTTAVTGNMGVSPAAATYITGFSLTADSSNAFSSSPQVTGRVFASDYAVPTPANLTTAVGDLETAFVDAAGRAANVTELGAGDIGGMTLPPGVYKWGTGLLIPTDVTLAGDDNDVWIFQIAQNLTVESSVKVSLSGGALAKNVYWQISGFAEVGTTARLEGIVMTKTSIALRTGASINGRLFAQTAVTLDASTVKEPSP
jgi:hypothetical protein